MSLCPEHGFYGGTSCTLCQMYGKGPMAVQTGIQYSVHDVHGNRKEWFVPDPELTMKAPTEEQLRDPAWWTLNAPSGCEKVGVAYIDGKVWSYEFMMPGVTAMTSPCNADVRFFSRPTKPEPTKEERLAQHIAERDAFLAEDEGADQKEGETVRAHYSCGHTRDVEPGGIISTECNKCRRGQFMHYVTPIKPEPQAWDGEGHPVIGEAFRIALGSDEDQLTTLVVTAIGRVRMLAEDSEGKEWVMDRDCKMYPLGTKEQRERQDATGAAKEALKGEGWLNISQEVEMAIEDLYDAGMLRKGAE